MTACQHRPLLWSGKTRLPVPPRTLIGQPALISPIRPDLAPNRGRRSELFDVILPRPSRAPIAGIIFPCRAPGTGPSGSMRCNFMQQHALRCHRSVARPYLRICNCSCHICTQRAHLLLISTPLFIELITRKASYKNLCTCLNVEDNEEEARSNVSRRS